MGHPEKFQVCGSKCALAVSMGLNPKDLTRTQLKQINAAHLKRAGTNYTGSMADYDAPPLPRSSGHWRGGS